MRERPNEKNMHLNLKQIAMNASEYVLNKNRRLKSKEKTGKPMFVRRMKEWFVLYIFVCAFRKCFKLLWQKMVAVIESNTNMRKLLNPNINISKNNMNTNINVSSINSFFLLKKDSSQKIHFLMIFLYKKKALCDFLFKIFDPKIPLRVSGCLFGRNSQVIAHIVICLNWKLICHARSVCHINTNTPQIYMYG